MARTPLTPELLESIASGDEQAARDLLPVLYGELRDLAAHLLAGERPDHTLQPTALVHEAYARLMAGSVADSWESKRHFFRVAARAMRAVLVDHARSKGRLKRGGDRERLSLTQAAALLEDRVPDLVELDEALDDLAEVDPNLARVVELRFFAGLTSEEAALVLDTTTRTVERRWAVARTWLADRLGAEGE